MRDYVAEDQGSGNPIVGQGVEKVIVHSGDKVTALADALRQVNPADAFDTVIKVLRETEARSAKDYEALYLRFRETQEQLEATKGELLLAGGEITRLNEELKDTTEALAVAESDLLLNATDAYWNDREVARLDERLAEADGLPTGIGSLKYVLDVAGTAYVNDRPAAALGLLGKALLIIKKDIAEAGKQHAGGYNAHRIAEDMRKEEQINEITERVSKGLEVDWEPYGIEILPLND
jgi:hypothetical protein